MAARRGPAIFAAMAQARSKRDTKVYGLHACLAVFRERPQDILRVFCTEARVRDLRHVLRQRAARKQPYHVVSNQELARVAGAVHHEGVCFVVRDPVAPRPETTLGSLERETGVCRLLALDGVDNPHNLGAILRSAAHFGAQAVIGAEGVMPRLGPAARRVAEGGAEAVAVIASADLQGALRRLQRAGFVLIATDAHDGEDLWQSALPARCVFLLGAERSGLSEVLAGLAERRVSIPGTGRVESLNVANAAAVLLSEHGRQHGLRPRRHGG